MTQELDFLLEQGQATERDVVEYLVSNYYDRIAHLAVSLLDDRDEADEIAQQTIIRAANKINQYRPHSNLTGWVYAIGLNLARQALRKRKRLQRLRSLLMLNREPVPSVEQQALRNEQQQLLQQAVAQLDDKHRIVLLLRYDHDLTTREIADALGIAHGTVRSRLHHAHQQLFRLLKGNI